MGANYSVWGQVWEFVSSSSFIQWAGSIAGVALLTMFKEVRQGVANATYKVKQMIRGNGHTIAKSTTDEYVIVNNELLEIKAKTDASRVSVWQFHNGDTFSLSLPAFKVKCTFEVCQEGVAPDKTASQSTPVPILLDVLGPLLDKDMKSDGVKDVTPKSTNPKYAKDSIVRTLKLEYKSLRYSHYKYDMDMNGTDHVYLMLLKSAGGKPMGILLIQYTHDSEEERLSDMLFSIYPSVQRIQFALDKSR